MRDVARILDARGTKTGKAISVLLSALLVFSFLNITMFTDQAAAEGVDQDAKKVTEQVADQPASAQAPGKATNSSDAKKAAADAENQSANVRALSAEDADGVNVAAKDAQQTEKAADAGAESNGNAAGGEENAAAGDAIDCPFTLVKTAPGEYTLSGNGEFKGEVVYEGEKKTLPELGYTAIKKLTIEEGVTALGDGVFEDYYVGRGMIEVVLPASCTRIGARAFAGGVLEKINLDHVVSVGESAFTGNGNPVHYGYGKGLSELTIPACMKEIGTNAFEGMMSLQKVTIEEGVETIGKKAFKHIQNLETVLLPESLKTIDEEAFSNCRKLKTVGSREGVCSLSGLDRIGTGAFETTPITNVEISDVAVIDGQAFYALGSIESLKLKNVDEIGLYAFGFNEGCKVVDLENVTIGESTYPFYEAGNADMVLNVTDCDLGKYAFWKCKTQTVNVTNSNVASYAFYQCGANTVNITNCKLAEYPFLECNAKTANINDMAAVTSRAFYGSADLETVNLNNVDRLEIRAFENCTGLKTVNGLEQVKAIDGFAFYGCSSLTGLTVEDLTKMGFNGVYADVMDRVQQILAGTFKLDSAPEIVELEGEEGWTSTKFNKSENWNTYEDGLQLVQQARWQQDSNDTVAEVKVDAYYTGKKQMDYVFVADLSASMAQLGNASDENARVYDMQSKLMDMSSQLLNSGDYYDSRLALVTFGGLFGSKQTVTETPFLDNAEEAKSCIQGIQALYENTDYGLGLKKALELVEANKAAGRNTTVIFLTDGMPTVNGSGDQDGTQTAAKIKAAGANIYGVLHSAPSEVAVMGQICDEYFASHDTESFGTAMNLAFAAAYPTCTVTIPVNSSFDTVQNLQVSVSGGSAAYDAATRTITWKLDEAMPFTKHTLTYQQTLNAEQAALVGDHTFDTNNGVAVMGNGATDVQVETPQLSRSVPEPVIMGTYRVVHEYYTNGQLDGTVVDEYTAAVGTQVRAADVAGKPLYNGATYTQTQANGSLTVSQDGNDAVTLRYYRTVQPTTPVTPENPDPTPNTPGDPTPGDQPTTPVTPDNQTPTTPVTPDNQTPATPEPPAQPVVTPTTPVAPATPPAAPTVTPLATVPAAPAAPAAAPAAPAAVPAEIVDDANPLAEAPATIEDDENPLAADVHPVCWIHYLIALGIVLTLIYAICVVTRRSLIVRKLSEAEDDVTGGSGSNPKATTAPAAGVA